MTLPCEAVHCFDRGTVRFAIYPAGFDGPRILAEISEDALRDVFGARGGPRSLVEACQANFETIEQLAIERHRCQPAVPIALEIMDFADSPGWPKAARRPTHAPSSPPANEAQIENEDCPELFGPSRAG